MFNSLCSISQREPGGRGSEQRGSEAVLVVCFYLSESCCLLSVPRYEVLVQHLWFGSIQVRPRFRPQQ